MNRPQIHFLSYAEACKTDQEKTGLSGAFIAEALLQIITGSSPVPIASRRC